MLLPASLLLAGMIVVSIFQEDLQVISWSLGTVITGSLLYPTLQLMRRRRWCEFVETTPQQFGESLYRMVSITEDEAIHALDSFSAEAF